MRLKLLLLVLVASPSLVFAQSSTSTVFRFLDVPPNARTAAMSGNHVALFQGDFSLFQVNPAYLNENSTMQVSASYVNFLADANYGFVSGAYHLDNVGTFGFGIRFAGYGEFDRLDENNNDLGTFRPSDIALTTGFGRELLPNLQAGASMDIIYSSIDDVNSSGLAFSGGLLYELEEKELTIGLSVRNLGTQLDTFNGENEPLPLDVAIGATHKPKNFPIRVSLMMRRLNDWDQRVFGEDEAANFSDNLFRHLVLGGEIPFSENFIFRLGYNHLQHEQLKTRDSFDFAGVGIGLGLKVNKFFIDFSRSSYSELGGIFQISIKTRAQTPNS